MTTDTVLALDHIIGALPRVGLAQFVGNVRLGVGVDTVDPFCILVCVAQCARLSSRVERRPTADHNGGDGAES